MRRRLLLSALVTLCPTFAQDLTPRAYVVAPVGSNAVIQTFSYNTGQVLLDPTLPIENLRAEYSAAALSYYYGFGMFGRYSNVTVTMPYAWGHFTGQVGGNETRVSRSGVADMRARLAFNLKGGPAMKLRDYVKWRERLVIGASLTMVIPSGQYDPAKLINIGSSRWALKPEIGFSRRWNKWVLDAYGGAWFFGTNDAFYPGSNRREQNAIASLEYHFGYYVRPRLWASFDGNYWSGGSTTLNGVAKDDGARNSRLGGTVSVPLGRHQSLKFTASRGAIIRFGGNYTSLTGAWQYSWISGPK